MSGAAAAIRAGFADPPPGFGPVPFWWWVGGTLEVDRLCWQLDRLREQGVFAAIVSYNHHADGTTNVGDPPVFSDAWWTIFLAVLDHARAHGMTLGIQDYSLLKPMLKAIGAADPALRGAELRHVAGVAAPGAPCGLSWPSDATPIEISAWCDGCTIDLAAQAVGNTLAWAPDDGEWQVVAVFAVPAPFDPLHAQSGARALAAFQEMIAARVGDHLGTTLTMFFQDELDFGARWPFWSAALPDAFAAAKGYPLAGRLAELFCARGSASAALRLDFADVAVGLLERHYFEPVHRWHERHHCLFGHDNAGRGAIAIGRDFYGDYMRTMRWYSAPGSDDPDLRGPRAFKGLKIASSIATLYDRPRVWAECFHSSGWGATPAAMLDGVNGVVALGATLINLHGLYYTTAGSWWEWAPPDFHFRQPYWACMGAFNAYATRLCWLMSQGDPVADVAILYPSAAIAGGLNPEVDPALAGAMPLSEAQRGEASPPVDAAEATAFSAARALFAASVGFDFIDDESVIVAMMKDGALAAGRGSWRTILLPEMTTIRWETLCRLHRFARDGGRVVALGALPRATDRADDPAFATMLAEMFGPGGTAVHLSDIQGDLAAHIVPPDDRDVVVIAGAAEIRHRTMGGCDIWFVRNPAPDAAEIELSLRGTGAASLLDPFSGAAHPLASIPDRDRRRLTLTLPAAGALVVMLDPDGPDTAAREAVPEREILRLEQGWRYALVPTMDNCFGDFASADRVVAAEVRRLRWCEGADPSAWSMTAPGHAPRLRCLGPLRPDHDLADWEAAVAATPPGVQPPTLRIGDAVHGWQDYAFSTRDGLLDDPFLHHWSSGPHGLKNAIPDDYIDLDGVPGDIWYVTTILRVATPGPARLVAGSRAAYRLWADGALSIDQSAALPPGRLPEWGLPHYRADPREAAVDMPADGVRVLMRLVHPDGQRLRAHIGLAGTPAPADRRLRWFADSALALEPDRHGPPLPQWFSLPVPGGDVTLALCHRGIVTASRGSVTTVAADDGIAHSRLTIAGDNAADVLLRIDAPPGVRAGDCILAPIGLIAPQGPIALGDWSEQGLQSYSGGVEYACSFVLDADRLRESLVLDTGPLGAVATVTLNGTPLGDVIAAPWRVALGRAARAGENRLVLRVCNTLANHYASATPTPYVFPGQTRSGLLGMPRILAGAA